MAQQLLRVTAFIPKSVMARCYNKIVMTDDGSTIVALHQEQEFPYEFSKPLPEEIQDNSILKMNNKEEVRRVFINMKPELAREELSAITLTTKHRWFPRARDKKAKRMEMNRPYL